MLINKHRAIHTHLLIVSVANGSIPRCSLESQFYRIGRNNYIAEAWGAILKLPRCIEYTDKDAAISRRSLCQCRLIILLSKRRGIGTIKRIDDSGGRSKFGKFIDHIID